jgi:two-component system CheB/CheR fusion protein
MRSDPTAKEISISIESELDGQLVLGDVVRIEQVVMNLLSNAIKFTPAGGAITLHLATDGPQLKLDVVDTGQGIAPHFLPHVFDMFGQSGSATTRSKGGLGIGLALVHEIVALHGGRLEAASEGPGKGARFSIWLPLIKNTAGHQELAECELESAFAGREILLVDDMEDVVTGLTALLESQGAAVTGVTSAREALVLLKDHSFDLVISDISMPEMDGYAFLKQVRQIPEHADLPAIAVTGMGRATDIAMAREAGFSAHIGKPMSLDRLTAIVSELLPAAGRSQRQQETST